MPAPKPTTDQREFRALTEGLEIRAADGATDARTASGYAVLYNQEANVHDLWIETIAPGAFDKSLQERDVLAVHSHDTGRVVGRKNAGTLTLRSDAKGLSFENPLPDTSDGRDLAVQIERGDIAGMSFGFRATKQEWDDTTEPPRRTILEGELYEITYTPMPVWHQTEVGLRSLEGARQERRSHNKTGALGRIAAKRMRLAQSERKI
ncbi:HK97 family phage prohead protease [Sphingobium sp. DC-2]|uniref:HK97 family phage prohead protease n=1 Tax=Sphingobium sp. DC-2 TaxID=1303256 RepID=UPI0004C37C3B|nr:HK97 family phage prohead protease [Sphingobium sp. DC-2]